MSVPGFGAFDGGRRTPRVLVLGAIAVETVVTVEGHAPAGGVVRAQQVTRYAGGRGANQAVAAAGSGALVTLLGCVGDDAPGLSYLDRLTGRGIDTSGVAIAPGEETGSVITTVDAQGTARSLLIPGANEAGLTGLAPQSAVARLSPGDVLLVSPQPGLDCRDLMWRARDADLQVVLILGDPTAVGGGGDAGPTGPDDVYGLIAEADVVILDQAGAIRLADLGELPASMLVVLGPGGSQGASWDGMAVVPPADAGVVLDASGADDALAGVLAAGLAAGMPREEALTAALVAGARAARHLGPQPDGELR